MTDGAVGRGIGTVMVGACFGFGFVAIGVATLFVGAPWFGAADCDAGAFFCGLLRRYGLTGAIVFQ